MDIIQDLAGQDDGIDRFVAGLPADRPKIRAAVNRLSLAPASRPDSSAAAAATALVNSVKTRALNNAQLIELLDALMSAYPGTGGQSALKIVFFGLHRDVEDYATRSALFRETVLEILISFQPDEWNHVLQIFENSDRPNLVAVATKLRRELLPPKQGGLSRDGLQPP